MTAATASTPPMTSTAGSRRTPASGSARRTAPSGNAGLTARGDSCPGDAAQHDGGEHSSHCGPHPRASAESDRAEDDSVARSPLQVPGDGLGDDDRARRGGDHGGQSQRVALQRGRPARSSPCRPPGPTRCRVVRRRSRGRRRPRSDHCCRPLAATGSCPAAQPPATDHLPGRARPGRRAVARSRSTRSSCSRTMPTTTASPMTTGSHPSKQGSARQGDPVADGDLGVFGAALVEQDLVGTAGLRVATGGQERMAVPAERVVGADDGVGVPAGRPVGADLHDPAHEQLARCARRRRSRR